MAGVGKPAPIQHFICLCNSRNVSLPLPQAAAAFTSDVKRRQLGAPALRQAGMRFFFFFFFFLSGFKM